MIIAQTANPPEWAQYGKYKPHPVVPEPSTYGAVFLFLCVVMVVLCKKFKK
jgi:hypothetical protein